VDALILLAEDDRSIRETTRLGLTDAGFTVDAVGDGLRAIDAFRDHRPDLVLLDVMLPGRDGLEVLRAIRADGATPVVMLTARTEATDVVLGLELGADDYVAKPFDMAVLVARVRANLRRARHDLGHDHDRATLALGPWTVDPDGHRVTGPDGDLHLTPTEFRLLVALAGAPGRVFTREVLLGQVWDYPDVGDTRLVDVAIQRLRAKVEADPSDPSLIETVRGFGYRARS